MNTLDSEKQRLLDLLVDGELSESQRRELLAWCEREPDGWRRCALAFLDAQSWSSVLGQMARGDSEVIERMLSNDPLLSAPAAGAPVVELPKATIAPAWLVPALALAASVLVAFSLGLWARGGMFGAGPAIAAKGASDKVRLVADGPAGAADDSQMPVAEGQGVNEDWLSGQPTAMPREIEQALERLGHRVRQQRQLVPIPLEDGRRVMVPVDQIDVQPMTDRDYQ
ncbi:MAG TPA: hypothetical protein VJ783_23440 [Pirellulales bacterium]|nr:hypothetical protein [Pirellulales bacterium]